MTESAVARRSDGEYRQLREEPATSAGRRIGGVRVRGEERPAPAQRSGKPPSEWPRRSCAARIIAQRAA